MVDQAVRHLAWQREYVKVTAQQGVQGDAVLLPGSGERCPGDSVSGPQLISLLSRSPPQAA